MSLITCIPAYNDFSGCRLFRLHITFCIMDHSVSNSTFNGTFRDEEFAKLRAQLEQANKGMNAIEKAAWRMELMERYDQLCTRYNGNITMSICFGINWCSF
uniref:Uncharacterized protein n=1 Tax=Ascaris lumbricoides TaxID=6252 RepID=A0A0M3I6A9_ASCLU